MIAASWDAGHCLQARQLGFLEDIMQIDSLRVATSARLAVVELDTTLQTAASCLSRPGVGMVVVCGDAGAAGVLTKSDLVRHLATEGAADAPVALMMSRPFVSCSTTDDVYGVWQTMTARRLQNVPVLGVDRKPVGILDIRDAMQALIEQEQYEERMLVDYITGVGYR
jgi:CBS domain-containing protein